MERRRKSNKAGDVMDSAEKITLRGGLSHDGRPMELVREKDGKAMPLAHNNDSSYKISKRALFDDEMDEDEVTRSMARRRKSDEPGDVMHTCRDCKREFKRKVDLEKHQKTHSRPWKCSEEKCKYFDLGWPTDKERDRHMNDKHSAAPARYKCLFPPCTYSSKRESNCKQHMEKAHGWEYVHTSDENDSSTIKCICGFSDDDGNTVLCEKCDTWQHITCYYASAQHVPDVHDCRDCAPRYLDARGAKRRQQKRRKNNRERFILEHYQKRNSYDKRKRTSTSPDSDLTPTQRDSSANSDASVPKQVRKQLQIVQMRERLKAAVKSCERCVRVCAINDSVECAVCRNTYHMNCVRPPLLQQPSRGFAWACGSCSRAQEAKLEARVSADLHGLIIRHDTMSTTTEASKSPYTRAADHRQSQTAKRPRYTISTDCTVSEVARNRMRFMALGCGSKHRMTRSGT